MTLHKRILIGSVSGMAIIASAAPVFAADPSTQVQEVVVTGIRQSLQKAIEVKRKADEQVDAISATDIGKLPDRNVADALQRLPGVNTTSAASGEGGFDENDRVSIRGTSPSLTQVLVDGHMVSTGDWFILDQFQTVGRSVSFDLLPSEIVQTAEVYKTQNAQLLEGGVAGEVNIETRKPLQLGKDFTFEASVQDTYNSLSKQNKPQLNGLFGWKSPDGNVGVILQGFSEDRSVERFGQETLGYEPLTSSMPIGAAFPQTVGAQAPTLIGSTWFQQEKKRDGGYGAVEWAPTSKLDFELSGFYSKLTATNSNDNYMYWGSHELATNTPTSVTVANGTLVGAVWPAGQDGLVVDSIERPGAFAESYYVNLDGKYQVNDKLSFKGQFGYTHGVGETVQSPSFEVDGGSGGISYAPSGNGWVVTPVAGGGYVGPQSSAGLANDWAWNEQFISVDKETYGKIDGHWDFAENGLKSVDFGVRMADHTRQVDGWDRGCSLGANDACWTAPAMPFSAVNPSSYPGGFSAGGLGIPGLLIPIAGNPNAVENVINGISDGVHGPVSSIVQPQNYYWMGAFKVNEKDTEGYVMANLGQDWWHGNVGVRIADTKETPHANISDPTATPAHPNNPGDIFTSAFGPYYATNTTYNYLDVLPSANFTFDLQKNLLLRLSAAETMSRPDFSALGGTVSLTDLTDTGSGGNPALKPIKAAVYDAALEYYYGPTSVAAISVFHDDLQSYVTYGVSSTVYYNQLNKDFEAYRISSPSNTSGELSGIELQVQQPIGYGFGFQLNGTYIDGHQSDGTDLVGLSKDTFNAVAYYENYGFSARLAYTYRSHFYAGLDRSSAENQADYGTLDASLAYQINKNVSFNLDATNITNNLLKYYAANQTQVRAVYENGTQVYGGFHLKF